MELFTLDPGLAVWTWIAFGILFFILWKFLLPSILSGIKSREEMIAGAVDNAEVIQKRLEGIKKEKEEILSKAGKEADGILADTRRQSEELKARLLEKAEAEAGEIISLAKKKAQEEREVLARSLREELASLVCDVSEKMIGESFTAEKDQRMIRELAEKL